MGGIGIVIEVDYELESGRLGLGWAGRVALFESCMVYPWMYLTFFNERENWFVCLWS